MADIDPAPSWAPIRQLETTDRNLAGPGGVLNTQPTSIAARLNLLRDNATALNNTVTGVSSRQDAAESNIASLESQVIEALDVANSSVKSVNGKTGVVQLVAADVGMVKASNAQAQAGTDDTVFMTPAKVLTEMIALTGMGGGTQKIAEDLNTIDSSRILRTTAGTLNIPAGMAIDGVALNMRIAADQVLQIWSTVREINATNRPCLFVRGYYGTTQTWGPWRRMADDSNVIHPGEFGLGAASIQVSNNIASLDNATAAGFYRAAAGATGNPVATGAFLATHMPSGSTANYGAQIGISEADGKIYTRLKTNNAWGSWIPYAFDTQVVHRTGDETVAGVKTYTNPAGVCARYNIGDQGQVEFGYPTGVPGIIFRNGNPADPANAWRTDYRQYTNGRFDIVVNNIAGDNTSAARGLSFRLTDIRPTSNNLLSLGVAGTAFSNVFTSELNISGTAAQKLASRRTLDLPITVSATAPLSPVTNDIWLDISGSGVVAKKYNGTTWV